MIFNRNLAILFLAQASAVSGSVLIVTIGGGTGLSTLLLAHPDQGPALDAWLAERESGALPPLRSPWARPGWWAEIFR